MAVANHDGPVVTFPAAGNLSSDQFKIVTFDTDGKVKLADDADVVLEPMVGVLQNKPAAEDRAAAVRIAGIAKVEAGTSIDEGAAVTTDGSGLAAVAVDNDWVLGFAVTAGVSGSLMEVLIRGGGGHVVPA